MLLLNEKKIASDWIISFIKYAGWTIPLQGVTDVQYHIFPLSGSSGMINDLL